MALSDWFFETYDGKEGHWPVKEDGEPETPVFIKHINGSQLDVKLVTGMLRAYDIPVFCTYPNDGKFGELVLGVAGPGVNIYVPESFVEDANNILSGEGIDDTEE